MAKTWIKLVPFQVPETLPKFDEIKILATTDKGTGKQTQVYGYLKAIDSDGYHWASRGSGEIRNVSHWRDVVEYPPKFVKEKRL